MLNSLPWNKKENAQCTLYISFFFTPMSIHQITLAALSLLRKFCAELCQQNFNPSSSYQKKKGDSKKDMKSRPSLEKDPTHAFYLITKVDE